MKPRDRGKKEMDETRALLWSRSRPEPPFLAGAVKKGAAPAPAMTPCFKKYITKMLTIM